MHGNLRQEVLKSKAIPSHDWGRLPRDIARMPKDQTPTEFLDLFLARTKRAREARGVTQQEIANALGIAQDLYSKYEVRTLLPHHLIPAFCLICAVEEKWLLSGLGKGPAMQAVETERPKRGRPRKRARAAA